MQPHPSADNWIKAFLSKALPTRARPSFSHHQRLPSGRLIYKPLSLIHRRADRSSKKNHSLTEARTKTTSQNVNQDEKAEDFAPDEGTRQNSRKKLANEVETENLPEKRIQNSDSEDDLGSQKKNGENSPRQSLQSSFNPCFSTLLFYDTHTHTTSA